MRYKKKIKRMLAILAAGSFLLGGFSVRTVGAEEVMTETVLNPVSEETEFETEMDSVWETETTVETEGISSAETEIETVSETDTEPASETETEWISETQTETEQVTEAGTETESEQISEVGTETESEQISEAGTETESEQIPEVGTETESEQISETGTETESELISEEPEMESELLSEADTEELETEMAQEDYAIMPLLVDLPPSGTPVTGASGWTQITGTERFSPDYYPVRFYQGISSMETFCTSSAVVQSRVDNRIRFYPTKSGEGGTYGVIYRKVLYYNNKWHDLKFTVAAYSTTVRCDRGRMVTSYPYVEFVETEMAIQFYEVMGEFTMKCEFLESGTGMPAKVNTRFQWWDIDSAQRFGIKTIDGSIAAKYYFTNSRLNVQDNQTVAGVSGLNVVVGSADPYDADQKENCAVFELNNCSSYYMAVALRDHIEDDGNSLSKTRIQALNEELAAGQYTGLRSFLMQTDTSMSIIGTPAPVKKVSNDGSNWLEENVLSSIRGEYLYQLYQFVPWQDTGAYYESFVIKDALPEGVDYVGNLQIIRAEDGRDVTGWFTVSGDRNVVMAAAKSETRASGDFYGYHYIMTFRVKMNPEKAQASYSGNSVSYAVKNQASVIVKHSTESSTVEEKSNTVITRASVQRQEQTAPKKGFKEADNQTEEILATEDNEIVFGVFQQIPVNDAVFRPSAIEMTDTLEQCLEYVKAEVKMKKAGSGQWVTTSGWTTEVSGQTIKTVGSCLPEYEGGTLLFQITCKIRKNVDLSPWQQSASGTVWTVIPNKASVTFSWTKGTPEKITKETNAVTVKIKETHIRLTKEIDAADIVWEHGNPVFVLKVEGTDLNGKYHVWYEMVEFTDQNTDGDGKAVLTADFEVPAGVYAASEEDVIRYRLKEIHSISGGAQSGETVLFDLSNGQDGAATFYNEKVTDEGESHTAFVRNQIGK